MAWINFEHPRPLLVDRDGAVDELVDDGTYPLGIFRRQRAFRRTEFRIEPGERILLYSDGIPKRRDSVGEVFGVESLKHTLRGVCGRHGRRRRACPAGRGGRLSPRPLRDDATILLVDSDPQR